MAKNLQQRTSEENDKKNKRNKPNQNPTILLWQDLANNGVKNVHSSLIKARNTYIKIRY